jgi:hypothetical protein
VSSGFGRDDKDSLNFDTLIEFSHQLPLELTDDEIFDEIPFFDKVLK